MTGARNILIFYPITMKLIVVILEFFYRESSMLSTLISVSCDYDKKHSYALVVIRFKNVARDIS